ncbi:MAG: thiazole synthase [Candidatus Omnitrophica bacterium]|nr:thiazole synthase [Candidatus Omnitrophota bacterium]
MEDFLEIAGEKLSNRLFIGTGKFSSYPIMKQALEEAKAQVATVALRRVDESSKTENIMDYIPQKCKVMINTSGARDAQEALRIGRLAKAAGAGNWIKIEVIRDNKYLLPDSIETFKAVEVLAKEGFVVFPYMSPDLSIGRRMVDAGASAIMPLGSPIGSNRGVKTRELIEIMVNEIKLPIIVDAGLGKPSEACECMELGCAAVLVNTAIAVSEDPVKMAKAFSQAVYAGRLAYLSGIPAMGKTARASSPLTGFLREDKPQGDGLASDSQSHNKPQ